MKIISETTTRKVFDQQKSSWRFISPRSLYQAPPACLTCRAFLPKPTPPHPQAPNQRSARNPTANKRIRIGLRSFGHGPPRLLDVPVWSLPILDISRTFLTMSRTSLSWVVAVQSYAATHLPKALKVYCSAPGCSCAKNRRTEDLGTPWSRN